MDDNNTESVSLKRSLSFALVTFYGLGTILGAGIYALVGKVAGHAGIFTPLAFLLASFIAFLTAISYAELSSRFPLSAGEAYYVRRAFGHDWLSGLIGWMVVFTGVVSAAAIAHGFVGYLRLFISIPSPLAMIGLIILLGAVAIWGIIESAMMAMLMTLIEIGGLLLVIYVAGNSLQRLPEVWHQMRFSLSMAGSSGVLAGAFIAFYAYIGFEDMVNIAEEIKHPEKTLPYAIFAALGIGTLLYVLVALVAILALPLEAFAQSEAPLALIFQLRGYSPSIIGMISLIAIVNGALVQIIMASRVIYGMAKQHNAPVLFATLYRRTQTPLIATLFVMAVIVMFALLFPIEMLAKITSAIILCIFIMMHLSLIAIKKRKEVQPNAVSYPILFPIAGAFLSALFLILQFL